MSFSHPLRLQSVVGKNSKNGVRHDDPYIQFLAKQHKRELEWKSVREAKRRKVQSAVQMTPERKTLNAGSMNGIHISSVDDSKMEKNVKLTISEVSHPVKVSTMYCNKR